MSLKQKLVLAAASAFSTQTLADDPSKIGFVYVSPVGHGWRRNQPDQGWLAVEKHFGEAVQTTYVENVNEGADAKRPLVKQPHPSGWTASK